jgi:hypothetical protein
MRRKVIRMVLHMIVKLMKVKNCCYGSPAKNAWMVIALLTESDSFLQNRLLSSRISLKAI